MHSYSTGAMRSRATLLTVRKVSTTASIAASPQQPPPGSRFVTHMGQGEGGAAPAQELPRECGSSTPADAELAVGSFDEWTEAFVRGPGWLGWGASGRGLREFSYLLRNSHTGAQLLGASGFRHNTLVRRAEPSQL